MESPVINKVIIIDDQFEEALPIIKALSSNGVYSVYWDGHYENQPIKPLNGVRLVILDMRFSDVTDPHLINTNLFNLLRKSVSVSNGPYILCVWSKHDNEYFEAFKLDLKEQTTVPQPYLITNIEKNDFVEITYGNKEMYDQIASTLDGQIEMPFKQELFEILEQYNPIQVKYKQGSIEKLFNHLNKKLEEINSLSTLLIWENVVLQAANCLVNDIASLSDSGNDWDDNIKNIIQRLAVANAGKSLGKTAKDYITNAFASLNHMLPDELWNQLERVTIDERKFLFLNDSTIKKTIDEDVYSIFKDKKFIVKKNNVDCCTFKSPEEIRDCSDKDLFESLHSQYLHVLGHTNLKLLCESEPRFDSQKPGKLYYVDNHDLLIEVAQCVFNDSDFQLDSESILRLVKLDVSSACDYAQNKLKKTRILFGILVGSKYFSKIHKNNSIYCTPELKIKGELTKVVFSLHHITNESSDHLKLANPFLGFRELLLTDIKQNLTAFISRVGIINI
ncbi:hypothetical protein [Paenibacillus brasilensis]|uniref:Response regulatory domain-containing protein n=1 Tax=Paenibacillus brasilensis TaxID=128574 RepID=A0ABU0L5Z4_9BACL|nr:hypothetical protein [Paenibacillus brasilensis]MDQ0496707.1 hypothetical protein [Paenibacillus brasilensis]